MIRNTSINIPTLVRIKPGALDRIGVYAARGQFTKVQQFPNPSQMLK